jgi:hypothetical protein
VDLQAVDKAVEAIVAGLLYGRWLHDASRNIMSQDVSKLKSFQLLNFSLFSYPCNPKTLSHD